jgi:peptide/nickel transport system substrate-binding protein
MANGRQQFEDLLQQFQSKAIDRRQFLTRASAAGLGAAASMAMLGVRPAFAQDATPAGTPIGTPGATPAGTPSTSGPGVITPLLKDREAFRGELYAAYPPTENPTKGGQYVNGDSTDITTTNSMVSDNSPTNPFLALVYEGLVGSSPVDGDYVPGLADTCDLSADGLTLTYKLHDGIKWHDGKAFSSADVKLSYDAQANPDTGSSYTGSFNGAVSSYRAVDDMTFEVTLLDTYARLPAFGNTYCPIVPAHIWQDVAFADWTADPGSNGTDPSRVVGTGPFKFQEWQQGTSATLVRNDDYWDDVPNIDQVIFRVYPDSTSAIEALRNGEIDSFENPDAADIESIEADGLTVQLYDTYSFGFFGYNLDPEKTPLFQQVEVRQALFYAIDRQSIVDNISLGYATVANGTQPTLSPAYAPDQIKTVYNYDLEKANQLLDQAGWTLGSDDVRVDANGNRLEFEVMYSSGSAASDQTVAYIQDQWSQIGAKMTPNAVDFSTVLVPTITETYDYDIAFLGFSWDSTGDQTAMFATSAYRGGFNFMKYSNSEYDRLAAKSNVEQDSDARRQLLIDASNIVNDDLPVGIISFRKDRFAINEDRVQNYHANAYGGIFWSTQYCTIAQ